MSLQYIMLCDLTQPALLGRARLHYFPIEKIVGRGFDFALSHTQIALHDVRRTNHSRNWFLSIFVSCKKCALLKPHEGQSKLSGWWSLHADKSYNLWLDELTHLKNLFILQVLGVGLIDEVYEKKCVMFYSMDATQYGVEWPSAAGWCCQLNNIF